MEFARTENIHPESTRMKIASPGKRQKKSRLCTFLYGHMSGVATVNHIAKTELIRDPDSFADVVRGLHVFGRKILRDEAVRSGVITIG